MKVTFGLTLDGYRPPPGPASLCELTCGPAGLLGWLENRLGLRSPTVPEAHRVAAFHQLLEQAQAGTPRFYTRSFQKDPIATADVLLRWRDDLVLDGWDGSVSSEASVRLHDLAEVERLATASLPPGEGDRLRSLLRSLEDCRKEIATVQTVDDARWFPKLWRQLLERLNAQPISAPSSAAPAGNSDLARVQLALRGDASAGRIELHNDGSLQLLTAYSELTLAHGAAQWLQAERKAGQAVALLADDTGRLLEDALLGMNDSALGIHAVSPARPIPQVLPLALRLHWKPLDPRHLLEFLTHPACPVTGWLRHQLAKALQDSPGVGGPRWTEAVNTARQRVGEAPELDADAKVEKLKRIEDDLRTWFGLERHDAQTGAPGLNLARTCNHVAQWAGKRFGTLEKESPGEAEMFRTLSAQAATLAELVKPMERVQRTQLMRLLEQVGGAGYRNPEPVAEVGHFRRFAHPAAIIEPVDTLLWWNFCEPSAPGLAHWTSEELNGLRNSGAEPLPAETILAGRDAGWRRAILSARGKLILAFPRQRGGTPVPAHPLLAHLKTLVAGELPTVDVDDCLRRGTDRFAFSELSHRPLPQPRRWWKLSRPELLTAREKESFSSAEKFVFSPFAWVLGYKAGLRPGSMSRGRPSGDMQVEGKLLHRLFDVLLAGFDWKHSNRAALDAFIEQCWPELCEQQAAHLLLPGRRSGHEELVVTAKEAMWHLLEHLRQADVVEAKTNVAPPAAPFVGGQMGGFLDLLVKNQRGEWSVIDLKLGGFKPKQEELANNRQLQLAVYGFLHSHGQDGRWPETAYYILNSAELLAQTANYFPRAKVVPATTPPAGVGECWNEFGKAWQWRRKLLNCGWVEVNVSGTEPTDGSDGNPSSMPPVERWLAGNVEPDRNDFSALTGWGEGR